MLKYQIAGYLLAFGIVIGFWWLMFAFAPWYIHTPLFVLWISVQICGFHDGLWEEYRALAEFNDWVNRT